MVLALALVLLACLVLIPLGLPGLWLMLAAAFGYEWLVPGTISIWTIVVGAVLATIAEVIEFLLAGRYARRYGGSRRAGWGAILGGIVGAFAGVPIFLVGAVIGAFIGSFIGALVFELLGEGDTRKATRVAWGALVGRVVASAMKVAVGVAVAAMLVIAAWR